MKKRKIIIGVTGSLAAGKTSVTNEFVSLGATRVDADAIAHDLLAGNEEIKRKIQITFGPIVMEFGEVNSKKLALEVFSDREKLEKLCGIIHPLIIERVRRAVSDAESEIVVVDAPLLFESGLAEEMDMVVVVTADEETSIKRSAAKGISEVTARKIMASQMPLEDKIKMADHVIINEDEIEKIKEGVKKVWLKK